MSGDQMEGPNLEVDENARINQDRITQTSGDCNPMLNSVVLERLFALCALDDLKRFRLVCGLWNEVALLRWRGQVPLTIHNDAWSEVCPKTLNWSNMEQIFAPPFDAIPYRSFRLDEWAFSTIIQRECHVNLEAYFVSYGSWMHRLTLTDPEIRHAQALKRVIFELTPNLKLLALQGLKSERVLRSLEFDRSRNDNDADADDTDEEVQVTDENVQRNLTTLKVSLQSRIARNSDWFPVSWREYLMHFPNIQNLELGNLGEDHIEELVEVLETIEGSARKIKKLDLQNVKLEVKDIRRILSIPQLQLDELHVQVRLEEHLDSSDEEDPNSLYYYGKLQKHYPELLYPTLPDPDIHYFIQEQAQILHTLHLRTNDLFEHYVRYKNFFSEVTLDSLTKLVLRGNLTDDWSFLQHTPNLKAVHIFKFNLNNMVTEESYRQVEELGVHFPRLEELRLKSMDGKEDKAPCVEIPPHTFEYFAKYMPNLKVLEAPLTDETFRVVCENWTKLRELYASNSNLQDYGITGIVYGRETRLPNITHLNYLEVFSTDSEHLTDTSVKHGFLQLPMLHTVNVWMSRKISEKARKAMQRRCSRY